uniref:Pre-mRNA splicing Prp18-interacting factor n=1 Tax=Tanacetum cinerariifolium TaxID=118510 RepID=A0A6L2K6D7_TANCI|nr:hypothetical protein [Tanacetum cinerariifolium]
MTSFDYRLNPLYPVKECSSCRALYTTNYCCSIGILGDKMICDLDKTPDLSQRSPQNCSKCGHPVNGHYCQGCALFQKKFKEDLFTSCIEHEILPDFSKPSNDNTNVVNDPREPFVGNQDPDDDDGYTFAITPNEPDNSLSMRDEHLDTIPEKESNKFIKSSVEKLIPNPSGSEGEHECDVPVCEGFTTFSNILFDADYDFYSVDDHSFFDEDIDFLFDEFAVELTFLKSIPSRIDETDCDPEEEIRLIEKLLYNNSSPRPPEEFNSKNSDAIIDSFSPSPIPVEDNDSLMEEIDLSFTPDYLMSLGIEEDDYDSKRDILIIEELLSNNFLSLPENESFHFDISPSSPAKPPDGLEAIQPSAEGPMMIYGKNTPILDVPLLHVYPP